jgi:2-oxoglutarate ferredoxin oxidoreductase subunit gamma
MTQNPLYEEILIAGFGGQGIILAGKLLAQTAMSQGKEVTYMPSYGAEVRGGTANCMVIIADEPIASPLVNTSTSLIVMNKASVNAYAPHIKGTGLLVFNSSLIDKLPTLPEGLEILAVPADQLAVDLGSKKSANMIILGAYLQKRGIFGPDAAAENLAKVLAKRYHNTIPINTAALHRGAQFVKNGK